MYHVNPMPIQGHKHLVVFGGGGGGGGRGQLSLSGKLNVFFLS